MAGQNDVKSGIDDLLRQISGPRDLLCARMQEVAQEDPGFRALYHALQSGPKRAPSLREAARLSGRSVATFKRHFRRLSGTNWVDYLREWRVRTAARLLQNPFVGTKEVAAAVGLSRAHFSRAFRNRFGVPPGEARKRLAEAIAVGELGPSGG